MTISIGWPALVLRPRRRSAIWIRVGVLLATALLARPPAGAGHSAPVVDYAPLVAGVVSTGSVVAAGVPLASGAWGTDYITVSHALRVGRGYGILRPGLPYADATPVTACSSHYHGIDVLILRAAPHPRTATVDWGDPADLRQGEDLLLFPRREFHPEPVRVRFVHLNLLEWTRARQTDWEPQWRNVMVGEGFSTGGFSGSPWARDGKVYGLHKGRVRPSGQTTWYVVAETAGKVRECLKQLGYDHLVPDE